MNGIDDGQLEGRSPWAIAVDPDVPGEPVGRTLDGRFLRLDFHGSPCRWRAVASISMFVPDLVDRSVIRCRAPAGEQVHRLSRGDPVPRCRRGSAARCRREARALRSRAEVADERVVQRLVPVRWNLTSWAAQRTRNSSLRVESSPTRSDRRGRRGRGRPRPAGWRRRRWRSLPVDEELAGAAGQEDEPGHVRRAGPGRRRPAEYSAYAERVGRQDVEAAVAHVGGGAAIESRMRWTLGRTRSWAGRRAGRADVGAADEVEEVRAARPRRAAGRGRAVEHVFGHAAGVAALEARVVLDADPGQHRDFFASQARDAALVAVSRQASLLRGDLRSPRDQELADVVPCVHAVNATGTRRTEGGPASTPINTVSLAADELVVPFARAPDRSSR